MKLSLSCHLTAVWFIIFSIVLPLPRLAISSHLPFQILNLRHLTRSLLHAIDTNYTYRIYKHSSFIHSFVYFCCLCCFGNWIVANRLLKDTNICVCKIHIIFHVKVDFLTCFLLLILFNAIKFFIWWIYYFVLYIFLVGILYKKIFRKNVSKWEHTNYLQ